MDETGSLSLDEARSHIAKAAFANRLGGPEVGSIGLEPEYLVFKASRPEEPLARLPLEGDSSVLGALERRAGEPGSWRLTVPGPPPMYELENGGRITFEPGGQVEHSTTIHETAASAMNDVDAMARRLNDALSAEGARLVSAGLDLWTDRSIVPQQLRAARYNSMDAFLSGRSEHGPVMMRHTGSFQVNVDLGEREVASERWMLANLVSPIATASFACSPEGGWKSRRARAWQGLDPSRTGYPTCMLKGLEVEPGCCYGEFALDADVLLFRTNEEGGAVPGTPGFNFRTWIERGHPEYGFPDLSDLDYHLTTIFPEVRLRGFFEIRSIDAIPVHLRAAQVVFFVGLLYDPETRHAAIERLSSSLAGLRERWHISAESGLDDADLRADAIAIWRLALQGAARMPAAYFRDADLTVADEFFRDFVERGRAPADELQRLLAQDPRAALDWCSLED